MPPLTFWYFLSMIRAGEIMVRKGLDDASDTVLDQLDKVTLNVRRAVIAEKKRRKVR